MKQDILKTIRTLLDPVRQRVLLMISRAIVNVINDGNKIQLLQISVLKDEILDPVERFQNFGHTSNPLPGAEAILGCIGGSRTHPIVLVVDDRRHRKLNLAPGESALYNAFGDYALLKADGSFEIVSSTKVQITSPDVEMSGTLTVAGLVTATLGITAPGGVSVSGAPIAGELTDGNGDLGEIRSIYNSHHHPQSGGGTTNVPNEPMT